MTTLNNIMQMIAPTPPKAAQGNGLNQQGPTLSDFLGMILSPADAAAATQNLPLSPADMKALTEKIAALLNGQGAEAANSAATASLTQDLSAALAAQLQNTEELPPLSEADMAELAQMMSDIEPGSGTDNLATQIVAALQAQGVTTDKAPQPAQHHPQPQPATPQTTTPMTALQNLLQLQSGEAQQSTQYSNGLQGNAAQTAEDAPLPAPQAQQPAADSKAQHTPQPQMPATTGQNTQGGMGQQGFGQNGFGGQQNGFTFFASADSTTGGLEGTTSLTGTQQSFAQYTQTATGQTLPPQTTQMIAYQIQRNAAAKVDSFTLQLEPADLGRLDVELKFHRDGSVQAHLTADRPETLAMLQKDSAHLERILQQAGFDTNDESLSFDLRQQNQNDDASGTGKKRAGGNHGAIGTDNNSAADDTAATDTRTHGYIGLQGVNIMV